MAVTFRYANTPDGARICYVTETGPETPSLHVLQTFYPCASVASHYSAALSITRGLAGGGSWFLFDWRGTGKSTAPANPIRFAGLLSDAEAVAFAIGEPFDLVAVNDSCAIVLALAARHPHLVRRLLLISPIGEKTASKEVAQLSAVGWEAEPVSALWNNLRWVHPGADDAELFELAKAAVAAKTPALWSEHAAAAYERGVLELGRSVAAPTLILYTDVDLEDALDLAAVMPNARAVNWTTLGDGSINGATWRQAWDEAFPPDRPQDRGEASLAVATPLSPRETEVVRLVCKGLSNAQIAEALVIAPATAKRHVANIYAKLEVSSRPQLMVLADAMGLGAPGR